jgi:putative toxin-antitoxin system antitoxin component (TIGR02293 family)
MSHPGHPTSEVPPHEGAKRKTSARSQTADKATAPRALIKNPRALVKNPLRTWYALVYKASPTDRITWIREGVPASQAKRLFDDLHIQQGVGFKALDLPPATVNKKAKEGGVLSRAESERVIGFAKLVGQLEAIIEESGDPKNFDAGAWLARWLTEPLPAFGGVRPADLMDTMEGQALVSSALAKLQSGAYA